ncbi:4-diphosphocytidyl-2-C-methyl-D-erythritol kinase [Salinihabitans flavidus]|uniref:4-diphosphocytidyl-2-C-methyl-D-erythritol kinase n=1 Tax=Salinihabitans flavidus TaxID=569882 RepID=A0A1H8SXM5_9RHOB|nr:4-(cytidine 5'-diphospho)-2-C-methyl-D-erythritol kinase [Salinihabitans flavidus]SEO82933.1 4-diphosphocytidyl-2-C-methyl-D-erythritol kinase [Salinihabitans flavidus]
MATEAFAPAKINLTLHVTGQRADGYHLLDSLVVFCDVGDTLSAAPADRLSLRVDGPMAAGVPDDASNLVMRAARFLDLSRGAAMMLTKRLPVASGIGGGSSDAAAALRALSALWDVPLPSPEETLPLGADVPVCMTPRPQRIRGVGARLCPVPDLPTADLVLVNPRLPVPTPAVFGALTRRDRSPMPEELPRWPDAAALAEWLGTMRNDLEAPAIRVQPAIADVLRVLRAEKPLHAAMSGSGATCYALLPAGQGAGLAETLKAAHPGWWVASGAILRDTGAA